MQLLYSNPVQARDGLSSLHREISNIVTAVGFRGHSDLLRGAAVELVCRTEDEMKGPLLKGDTSGRRIMKPAYDLRVFIEEKRHVAKGKPLVGVEMWFDGGWVSRDGKHVAFVGQDGSGVEQALKGVFADLDKKVGDTFIGFNRESTRESARLLAGSSAGAKLDVLYGLWGEFDNTIRAAGFQGQVELVRRAYPYKENGEDASPSELRITRGNETNGVEQKPYLAVEMNAGGIVNVKRNGKLVASSQNPEEFGHALHEVLVDLAAQKRVYIAFDSQ